MRPGDWKFSSWSLSSINGWFGTVYNIKSLRCPCSFLFLVVTSVGNHPVPPLSQLVLTMAALFYATLLTVLAMGYCGQFTVTEEVWFDVEVKDLDGPGEDYKGRFVVAVFGEAAPMTTLNFVSIAKGYKKGSDTLHYKDTKIHRIVQDFVIQMGDITTGDGSGGKSIFGDIFNDEEFILSHRSAGWVAMANHGPDTNGSQFYILLTKARWLDGKHVVFGKVIRGFDVIDVIGNVPSSSTTAIPKKAVRIVDSGVNSLEKKYDLTKEQLESTDDL